MVLQSLKLFNFKNLEESDLKFSEKLNCFTGNNGSGKTNLLDAVYYLSFTKSYFNVIDTQNIRHGNDLFYIKGEFRVKDKVETVYCGFSKAKKKIFKRNDKAYKKFSEHIGLFPVVFISPDDGVLITGTSEERRKYIDTVISQYDKAYLHELIRYDRILSQRNKLLKDYNSNGILNYETLQIYNKQLESSGILIFEKRKEFITELIPIFRDYYERISKNKEEIDLKYQSQLHQSGYSELLESSFEKDKVLGYTTKGIHRDDLDFSVNDHPLKKTGSQGQQKTFLIALKFSQYEFIKDLKGINPLLLLDDIFDKFDSERVEEIIKLTSNSKFGQIFLTDTNPTRVKKVIDSDSGEYKIFNVSDGVISEQEL
jgi:DNA replication and repair protein RecF